ncbi:hypothetical protein PTTG_07304 [Puccinia triticina 1-1 BBBD Race 1]|uniref:DUF676 domain-containing protein n=2 Tax=Puccinia triticina TaxID=208348 RepID=A0A180GYD9_PUCT1|nr:uncharacterized protein PtA15_15A373 [Puccinia triticina]OAV97857.1 hypothetical protein PTTG_07304 [Puccinia triticina 1-1 BBBD Race 1]WAQ91980.1 hypothetical protein PtA15_15A373 [Puccinia triticina]WAR62784.1 hypothetical protein PtB15_15B372 [Puccinia triticina]
MSAARTARPSEVHLVVIIHGLWGSPEHVSHLASTLRKISAQSSDSATLDILIPNSIQWTNTYDGIDYCAEHVAQEIDQRRSQLEMDGKVLTKFSCIGYSLGGLISRFLVGLLHSRQPSFFEEVEPMNFNTFASPWIGMPKYKGILSSTIHFFGSRLLSRTGNQLYLTDKYHQLPSITSTKLTDKECKKKFPLLSLLAHPETNFYKALVNFKVVRIYANAINDRTVPFVTGAIEKFDLFQIAHQISKRSKIDQDLTELEALEIGGLELTFNRECASLIEKVQLVQVESQPEKLKKSEPKEGPKTRNGNWKKKLPKLPFFLKPSTYPYRAPLNYVAAGLSPVIAPMFLTYILCSFCYQSFQSRQRIKKYNVGELENHFSRLSRVGLLQELRQDLIEDLAGIGNEPSQEADPVTDQAVPSSTQSSGQYAHPERSETEQLIHVETPTSALHPPDQLSSVDHQTHRLEGTQYLTSLSSDTIKSVTHDLGLSPLQIDMLDRLNQLPNLTKFFSFLDGIPNSHGAIIYRVDGLSDRRGKRIVSHWAERFIL